MSLYKKLKGTIETILQLGLGGPNVKNNSGVVEFKNAADSAFAIARGDTPVGVNDLSTKAYSDAAVRSIRFTIDHTAAQASTTSIPANARVYMTSVEITGLYTAGGTITVGSATAATLLQATTDNDPQTANTYILEHDIDWGVGASTVRVAVGGAPAAGTGVVIVNYLINPGA